MMMPVEADSKPKILLMACPESTVPVAAKPRYMMIIMISGRAAPLTPKRMRLEIICGRPSRAPCDECSAMTAPPTTLPMNRPMIADSASEPKTMASAPSTTAVICRLALSHRVNWLDGLPWRADSGIALIVFDSSTAVFCLGWLPEFMKEAPP